MFRFSSLCGLFFALLCAAQIGLAVAAGSTLPRSQLTFVGYETADSDIFIYDTLRGRLHNLTHSPGFDLSPAWSPDGEQIAFASDRDGGLQVYLMDATGGNVRRLTPNGRTFESPRWSVDGERIYVMARTNFTPDIYAVSPEGGSLELISGQTVDAAGTIMDIGIETFSRGGPVSPTGSGVVVSGFTGREWALYLSPSEDAPGELLTTLGAIAADSVGASWSNDGRHIAFLSAAEGSVDVFIMPPQPGAPTLRLTADRNYERDLVWRPG